QLRGCLTLNHYGYTGQEYDPETALFHFFARYYDADGGTWITQDTYKGDPNDPSTLARYQYVKNNPISFYDPDGRKATQASLEASKLGNRIQGALNEGVGNQAVLCNKNYYYNPMNSGAYLRPDYLYKGTFFDLKPNTYSGLRDGVSSVTKYSSIGLEPGSQWDRWTMNIPRTAVDPKNNILYEVKFKSPGVLAYSQAPKLSQWTNKIASSRTFSAFGKVTLVVGVALSIYDIGSNIYQESKEAGHLTIGKESSKAIGRNVGAWTGGFVGAKIGAAVGGAVGSIIPGVGTAAGALIGGVVGGVTGAIIGSGAGEKIGEWVHDNAGKAKDWIGDQAKKADSWLEDHGLKFW
ncbi:MAG: hypothetical protein KKB13_08565, partial [Chloroflexi bacterium]|nr:hypothetical protein [Chloroflexota bacterium]